MVTNVNILKAINRELAQNFRDLEPKIYIDENNKDITKPTFFVQVEEITSTSRLQYTEDTVKVYITYTNKELTQLEKLEVKQKLKECFDIDLELKDDEKNVLIIDKRDFSSTEDILLCTLTFYFLNSKDKQKDYDILGSANMEHLEIDSNTIKYEFN